MMGNLLLKRYSLQVITLWLLICHMLLMTACRNRQQNDGQINNNTLTTQQSNDQTTLRIAVPNFQMSDFQALATAFEADHPQIHIQLLSQDDLLAEQVFSSYGWSTDAYLQLARNADVFSLTPTPDAVKINALYNLAPLFEAEDENFRSDFYPVSIDQFRWDNGLWSLPSGFSPSLIYYNKTLFDAANIPYPTADWEWATFESTARSLTLHEGDTVQQWGFVMPSSDHTPLVLGRLQKSLSTQQLLSAQTYTSPQFATAVKEYTSLFADAAVAYNAPAGQSGNELLMQSANAMQIINDGRAAMWEASALQHAQFVEQLDIGMVPYPQAERNAFTTPIYSAGFSMSAGTPHADAAWQWLRYLSTQAASRATEQQIPARVSVAEAYDIWSRLPVDLADVLRSTVERGYPANNIYGAGRLDAAVNRIVHGNADVASELQLLVAGNESATTAPQPTAEVILEAQPTRMPDGLAISFATGHRENMISVYRSLAEQFVVENPNIQVLFPSTQLGSMTDAARVGNCFRWPPQLDSENQRLILSLNPFIDADPSLNPDDFYPALVDSYSDEGVLWGLPSSTNMFVIKYNKQLFDQAGIPYPQPGWTTDAFLETALALTRGTGEDKRYGFVADSVGSWMSLMLEPLGGEMIDDNVTPATLALNDPKTVEAVRWLTNLVTLYEVSPGLTPLSFEETIRIREKLIAQGQVAMWLEWSGEFNRDDINLNREAVEVGVVSLPIGPNGASGGYDQSLGLFIAADATAEQQQACWRWITFLSQQPTAAAVSGVPARRSSAESAAFRQLVGEDLAAAYLSNLAQGREPAYSTRMENGQPENWMRFGTNWFIHYYDDVIAGNRTVDQAMTSAQVNFESFRACVIDRDGVGSNTVVRQCFCDIDASLPSADAMPESILGLICGEQ